jgi:Na+/H+-dicarboxylate symporter
MAEHAKAGLSLGTRALIGLAAGLAAGAGLAATAQPALLALGSAVEVVGTLWIDAILMTILSLVVSKLIVSIAGHDDQRALGRSGWKAAARFLVLLSVTAVLTAAIMPAIFARLPMDPAATASLRAAGAVPSNGAAPPTAAQVVVSFVPTNAIRAAAAGLPLEARGLLLAVNPIPNAFRTVANVTGMLAATVLAGGEARSRAASP